MELEPRIKIENRPLTQEELDLAPKWATHYIVDEEGDVCFKSDDMYEWLIGGQLQGGSGQFITPTPPKPFDIESVEWSDKDVKEVGVTIGGNIATIFHSSVLMANETKQDIINKAKALGITAEDLK